MKVTASAPGKVILLGEHFVVYGGPAIVAAIDRRAHVSAEPAVDRQIHISSPDLGLSGTFTGERFRAEQGGRRARAALEPIRIAAQRVLALSRGEAGVSVEVHSSIPVASGLGSSAAVAAATAAAVGRLSGVEVPREEVFRIAYEAERFVHGTPSGIDPAIATYGGVISYRRERGFAPLDVKGEVPLVVGDTGVKRSTGGMVAAVRELRERHPSIVNLIMETGEGLALRAAKALSDGDLATLGELMNINHGLLSAIGVSHEALERLVYAARRAGALGAKLTGGGGGGCMVALAPPSRLKRVVHAIEGEGGTAFVARETGEGVRVEG